MQESVVVAGLTTGGTSRAGEVGAPVGGVGVLKPKIGLPPVEPGEGQVNSAVQIGPTRAVPMGQGAKRARTTDV
ncbi:MAG: hypothetical protein ACRDSP_18705 [Pseudonocardiaceae bacterium]